MSMHAHHCMDLDFCFISLGRPNEYVSYDCLSLSHPEFYGRTFKDILIIKDYKDMIPLMLTEDPMIGPMK